MIKIKATINGETYEREVNPSQTLLDFLREDLNITSPKKGCDTGECGACTVIMNGRPVNSCLVLAPEIDGAVIETVESLAKDGKLHPLQDAFIKNGAIQCGYCTPGMLMSAKALLDRNPDPTKDEVIEAIAGNLCRCTGYASIVDSVLEVAGRKGKR